MLKRPKPNVSNPAQHVLDELFAKTTRVRVLNGGASRDKALGKEVLLDVSDAGSIAYLHGCLTIIEDENTFGHCACLGDQALEVYGGRGRGRGRRRLATIGLHHGRSIRWDAWRWDALLKDGRGLLAWMADRGVPQPLAAFEEDHRRALALQRAALRWRQATPACLIPLLDSIPVASGMALFLPGPEKAQGAEGQLEMDTSRLAPLLQALEVEYPDRKKRILELFRWYGSGEGPWSGYPSNESIVEELLLTFPAGQLSSALIRNPLTPVHLEGAARFFAGYYFTVYRQGEARQLPGELKQRLLAHVLEHSDEDKIGRARSAFSGHDGTPE